MRTVKAELKAYQHHVDDGCYYTPYNLKSTSQGLRRVGEGVGLCMIRTTTGFHCCQFLYINVKMFNSNVLSQPRSHYIMGYCKLCSKQ